MKAVQTFSFTVRLLNEVDEPSIRVTEWARFAILWGFTNSESCRNTIVDSTSIVWVLLITKGINLVDPASCHMLVSKIKPCMSKFIVQSKRETANGSLNQLLFICSSSLYMNNCGNPTANAWICLWSPQGHGNFYLLYPGPFVTEGTAFEFQSNWRTFSRIIYMRKALHISICPINCWR